MNSGNAYQCPSCEQCFETRAQLVAHINGGNTGCEWHEQDEAVDLSDSEYYLSRELSKLAFNRRVLQEAIDEENPLLERVKFLAIFTENMDEFFMKRVGGLKQQRAASVTERTPDGRRPDEHWEEVLAEARPMLERQVECYRNGLGEALDAAGIEICSYDELTPPEQTEVDAYFEDSILPTLTPLTIDSAKPFPHISNLSLSLGVLAKHPGDDDVTFSRIKMPKNRPRFVQIGEQTRYILLEELVRANLDQIFPNAQILEDATFRVTRNAEVRRNEEVAEDLLQLAEEVIEQRRFATVVRLEVEAGMSDQMLEPLLENLDIGPAEVFRLPGPLDFSDFMTLTDIDRPELKLPEWTPKPHPRLGDGRDATGRSIFEEIREDDILVHHPYHSFNTTVQRFLDEAATDPDVLAIKAAIYRTASDSEVIQRLIDAAENGKQVAVMVELKARFDEENNLEWAQRLEEEGIHVAYGTIGYKTHTKTALVVREEDDGVELYSHIGTGNYHSETAKRYEDLGLFTANRDIGQDLVQLFNYFTGNSVHDEYRELLIAPGNMRERFVEAIRREAEHARAGEPARIAAKMNRLEDPEIVEELYRASQAGVEIDLVVRDICRLRPGLAGISENISVVSIVNRFLEHSRIYYFRNGGDEEFYIGSADWMERNLDNRVEAAVPIHDPELRARIRHVLDLNLSDNTKAWELNPDGSYTQRSPGDEQPRNAQTRLMEEAEQALDRR
ncbi:polyphosphate kinase 1 [Halovenus sp. WSH3]|uniref:Polyphosphate kinase n=1 Tax=Halovenus carboxidivorans TaxID=2692199 RepID=A0A6B0TCD3_9EURY|nr:polyphosphate kinase 1 [Halovenus carboxidivorans]MXR53062.1 polyphosphate kinase 1 [Halovenus carboxidivorans]